MEWKTLSGSEQIDQIIQESFLKPVAIFKHSTRCSISPLKALIFIILIC